MRLALILHPRLVSWKYERFAWMNLSNMFSFFLSSFGKFYCSLTLIFPVDSYLPLPKAGLQQERLKIQLPGTLCTLFGFFLLWYHTFYNIHWYTHIIYNHLLVLVCIVWWLNVHTRVNFTGPWTIVCEYLDKYMRWNAFTVLCSIPGADKLYSNIAKYSFFWTKAVHKEDLINL